MRRLIPPYLSSGGAARFRLPVMEPLIRPEPSQEERRAILAALAEAEPRRPVVYESRWREAALEEGVSGDGADGSEDGFPAS
jgi:hypothetical protein